eukprot:CAMPEP_0114231500 /NCGR_PEP_ID=MMETSP0058-20121206/4079_1 /TAXON_ID=36894 /ORGANISM="Pyramimonas parkeae, CCMP726" /LENGTH=63 /DNA_ID=CAMNT_0001342857 /DNA_START=56 /DNA_END=247 /DNA_ORIENTATION=-
MGFMDAVYRQVMTRNSLYVTFVITGALIGERVVDSTVDKLWEANNKGKLYKDLLGTVIGASSE